MSLKQAMALVSELHALPHVTINLQCAGTVDNDPFYGRVVREFYRDAMRRHPKFPLIRNLEYGFSLHHMGDGEDEYLRSIESAGRRNYKKSCRLGYHFDRIDFNAYLDDVTAILRSTPVRQGRPMPEHFFTEVVAPVHNPPSRTHLHDYPYFGILRDGHLHAYASCIVAGELCSIESIYGHAEHLADGVVPMLVIEIAKWIKRNHPGVHYYAYGTYYGATETMQRFKRKFDFMPHKACWVLGD